MKKENIILEEITSEVGVVNGVTEQDIYGVNVKTPVATHIKQNQVDPVKLAKFLAKFVKNPVDLVE